MQRAISSLFSKYKRDRFEMSSTSNEDAGTSKPESAVWRLPESESFADWLVIIKSLQPSSSGDKDTDEDSGRRRNELQIWKTDTYHVHRSYLAVGARACNYFSGIMSRENFREGGTRTTEVVLHELTAKCFAEFLDFIYTGEVEIEVESFIPLQWLARYFGNESLAARVRAFSSNLVPKSTDLLVLYEQAKSLNEEEVFDVLAKSFSQSLMTWDWSSLFSHFSERNGDLCRSFLRDILPKISPHPAHDGRYNKRKRQWMPYRIRNITMFMKVSRLLLHFFEDTPQEALPLWRELTSIEKFPVIKGSALAFYLLCYETNMASFAGVFKDSDAITELQDRCLKSLEESQPDWVQWKQWEQDIDTMLQDKHPSELARRLHRATMQIANKRQRLR